MSDKTTREMLNENMRFLDGTVRKTVNRLHHALLMLARVENGTVDEDTMATITEFLDDMQSDGFAYIKNWRKGQGGTFLEDKE